ncbi:MAG: UDP-2,3-diacylglucosamine diphosphatase [Dokdonella sp.]
MTTLFVSDLHLDASRPCITELFIEFMRDEADEAQALYILGDLFEAWIGDDVADPAGDAVALALAELHERGIPSFFIHGNRDFLLGDAWARRARLTLLADPALITIESQPTLLMHGDTLCIDDTGYQTFRTQVHAPEWQRNFLARSGAERNAFAAQAREESRRQTAIKESAIMDVNADAVIATMRDHNVTRLIHGHTHRPAIHRFDIDCHPAERIVLGDWYEQGSVLRIDGASVDLAVLPV